MSEDKLRKGSPENQTGNNPEDQSEDPSEELAESTSEPTLAERLNQETGVIVWSELVRHFARGVVIHVSAELDLIDAATCLIEDNATLLAQWTEQDKIRRASDDDARDWTQREPEFWCVVTAPWVLVQEKRHARRPTVH